MPTTQRREADASGPGAPSGGIGLIKRLLLFFWAVWLTLVTASNICDGLKARGVLEANWPFASGNRAAIVRATASYAPSAEVIDGLFLGVIVWEAVAALLFWRAALLHGTPGGEAARNAAFTVSLGLWAAFLITEEVLIDYPLEAVHFRLLTAQLATLLVLALVHDTPRESS